MGHQLIISIHAYTWVPRYGHDRKTVTHAPGEKGVSTKRSQAAAHVELHAGVASLLRDLKLICSSIVLESDAGLHPLGLPSDRLEPVADAVLRWWLTEPREVYTRQMWSKAEPHPAPQAFKTQPNQVPIPSVVVADRERGVEHTARRPEQSATEAHGLLCRQHLDMSFTREVFT